MSIDDTTSYSAPIPRNPNVILSRKGLKECRSSDFECDWRGSSFTWSSTIRARGRFYLCVYSTSKQQTPSSNQQLPLSYQTRSLKLSKFPRNKLRGSISIHYKLDRFVPIVYPLYFLRVVYWFSRSTELTSFDLFRLNSSCTFIKSTINCEYGILVTF